MTDEDWELISAIVTTAVGATASISKKLDAYVKGIPRDPEGWRQSLWEAATELNPADIASVLTDVFNVKGQAEIIQGLTPTALEEAR